MEFIVACLVYTSDSSRPGAFNPGPKSHCRDANGGVNEKRVRAGVHVSERGRDLQCDNASRITRTLLNTAVRDVLFAGLMVRVTIYSRCFRDLKEKY